MGAIIISFIIGGCVGFITAALLAANKQDDET